MFNKRERVCFRPMVPGDVGEDDINPDSKKSLKEDFLDFYDFKAMLTEDAIDLGGRWGLPKDNKYLEPEKQRQMYEIFAKRKK